MLVNIQAPPGTSLAGQTLFYLCVVTGVSPHSMQQTWRKQGKSRRREGKESGEKIHFSCAHWNVNGMFVVEETHDKLLTCT